MHFETLPAKWSPSSLGLGLEGTKYEDNGLQSVPSGSLQEQLGLQEDMPPADSTA